MIKKNSNNNWDTRKKYPSILNAISAYSDSSIYPMHMPGHKRKIEKYGSKLPYALDMTETTNMADLHNPTGHLKEAQEKLANFRGAAFSRYLVSGSTCANLSGIRSVCSTDDKILVARNCHQSIYHAIELLQLEPIFFLPMRDMEMGIYSSVSPALIKSLLAENSDCKLLIITSPTYEGIISDISSIAKICHDNGVLLMVDQAHGAHFAYDDKIKEALECGADIVVESLHKTLPALTPSALIHVSSRVDSDYLAHNITIFETSSPSHIIMASIEECLNYMNNNGKLELKRLDEDLIRFELEMEKLNNFKFYNPAKKANNKFVYAKDRTKLLFNIPQPGPSISYWKEALNKKGFECEMYLSNCFLAMATIADDSEDLKDFASVILELDSEYENIKNKYLNEINHSKCYFLENIPIKANDIRSAMCLNSKKTPLKDTINKVSSEYVFAYPPGIPLLIPGEIMSREVYSLISSLIADGQELRASKSCLPSFLYVLDD